MRSASGYATRATAASSATASSGMKALLPWGMAAVALIVAGVAWGSRGEAAGEPPVVRYELAPPENGRWAPGLFSIVAVGPGGGLVAYEALGEDSVSRLYLRSADDVVPRAVAGSERAILPFFSPDGEFLAFWSGSQFRKVAVNGGRPVSIVDAPPAPTTWTPSGWLVAASPQGIHRAPAAGGEFELIARVDSARGETVRTNIVALADGETVMFSSFGMGGGPTARLGLTSLKDGATTMLDISGVAPLGMVDGFLVYATAAGVVMAVPFDVAARRVTGTPLALIDQVAVDAATNAVHASLSADGTLAYLSGVTRRQLVLVGSDGGVRPIGEPGAITWPRFSPDGRRIAMTLGSASIRDVWVYDLPNGPASQLTRGGSINDRPEWSPDGNSIIFRSDRGGRNAIYRQSVDGGPDATLLYGRDDAQVDEGVLSPDGATLAVQRDATGDGEVWLVPMQDGGEARRFDPQSGLYGARFSPDGRWLAYAGAAGGGEQVVHVRATTGGGRATRISSQGGTTPVWAPDGRRLFYVNGRELMVVNVESTSPFRVGSPRRALTGTYTFNSVHADYDISRDGRSILALRSPEQSARIVVVRNLGSELRARFRQAPR
jgi:serine/threonine-protein kinase